MPFHVLQFLSEHRYFLNVSLCLSDGKSTVLRVSTFQKGSHVAMFPVAILNHLCSFQLSFFDGAEAL